MKECTKCKQILPLENFCKKKDSKDGLQYWCKCCVKEYNKNLYHTNDTYRQNQIDFNHKHCGKKAMKKFSKTNKFKKAIKKYHQSEKGKEAINKASRKYRKTSKGKVFQEKRDNFGWVPLMENPLPDEVEIEWHHINDLLVIPLPKTLHRDTLGKEHRNICIGVIKQIYCIDISKLLELTL